MKTLPNTKGKAFLTVSWIDQPSTWNLKKTRIMKLNHIFRPFIFPLQSLGKLYNWENMTVTLLLPWDSHKDHVGSCVQSGCHNFIGWQYVMLTYISGEGMTCRIDGF